MKENQIIFYQTEDGQTQIDVRLENDTVAAIFGSGGFSPRKQRRCFGVPTPLSGPLYAVVFSQYKGTAFAGGAVDFVISYFILIINYLR